MCAPRTQAERTRALLEGPGAAADANRGAGAADGAREAPMDPFDRARARAAASATTAAAASGQQQRGAAVRAEHARAFAPYAASAGATGKGRGGASSLPAHGGRSQGRGGGPLHAMTDEELARLTRSDPAGLARLQQQQALYDAQPPPKPTAPAAATAPQQSPELVVSISLRHVLQRTEDPATLDDEAQLDSISSSPLGLLQVSQPKGLAPPVELSTRLLELVPRFVSEGERLARSMQMHEGEFLPYAADAISIVHETVVEGTGKAAPSKRQLQLVFSSTNPDDQHTRLVDLRMAVAIANKGEQLRLWVMHERGVHVRRAINHSPSLPTAPPPPHPTPHQPPPFLAPPLAEHHLVRQQEPWLRDTAAA